MSLYVEAIINIPLQAGSQLSSVGDYVERRQKNAREFVFVKEDVPCANFVR